ncbi:rho guanine nucleotide exchange factor 18 isoform X5 [Salmo salar]|uniref:Rho guanine nucleotide exchange factor 18 isoform X5 n=1 Tax=Salmo salar TaxID=8030 RepID=A0ABM3CBF9_SALSA|nr:rho guanine nucleotide exchange factor 18-like isoform X5 [Salmo salar]
MADSPLNNSWPSFSKLWMKRWSFKRGSECKPCSTLQPRVSVSEASSLSSSLSPASVAKDIFFNSATEEKDGESDYENPSLDEDVDSSVEDLLGLSCSFIDSNYYKDHQGVHSVSAATETSPPTLGFPSRYRDSPQHSSQLHPNPHPYSYPYQETENKSIPHHTIVVTQFNPNLLQSGSAMDGYNSESVDPVDPVGVVNTMVNLNGPGGQGDMMDSDRESFPILIRSMSTSRRHSLGMPMSPIDLGRRLSLDAIDSDGERDDSLLSPSHQQAFIYPGCPEQEVEESDGTDLSRSEAKETETEECSRSGRTYSRAEILATDERVHVAHVSRVVETSKRAAGEELDPEEPNLHTAEGQTHIARQRTTRPEGKETGSSVTWYEFLSNENEEEEDRTEKVEKGTKVKRTLSSLRSRMTGSFNKDKGKNREKEQQKGKEREPKEKEKLHHSSSSGHNLVPGSFSSCATCSLCSKALQKKHGLQCLNCAVNVHKSCRTLLAECNSSKNKKDSLHKTSTTASLNLALSDRDQSSSALDCPPGSPRIPGMTLTPRGPSAQPASAAFNSSSSSHTAAASLNHSHNHSHNSHTGSLSGDMDEPDSLRFGVKRLNEDAVSLAPSTTDSIVVEDAYYSAFRADLESDAQDLEVESWSLAVDQQYLKKYTKEMVKRQDVIYELMQTEMHHVRTLKIMLRVYMRELKEHLQMGELFPRLESLLELHTNFLSRLKERRRDSMQPGSDRNYNIQRLADILTTQFSGEKGDRMKENYGDFCSHHTEAVNYYKEQLHNNRKFQSLIRKVNNLSVVRRLGVTECILLVTQRITKYPVLVERIVQNTEVGTEEHEELTRSLGLIKDCIVQVDALVNLHEKASRLRDIAHKMEPKSLGKIKDGRVFHREDLAQGRRRLLHEGTANHKAASGRLKDVLAVLLSDVLLLLQEKDQRYVFSTVDNKPSVISLQKLIVREVAHEEKAMFLICASSNEPEMYEIHTASKEERNSWMTHIRQAVESCPHTEERLFSEQEEARAARFNEFQERLSQKDTQIVTILTEKLQLFSDMCLVSGHGDTTFRSHLMLRGDASDLHQGETLLKGTITDVESLQNLLLSGVREPASRLEEGSGSGALPRRADTFGGYDSRPIILNKKGIVKKKNHSGGDIARDGTQKGCSDPQLTKIQASQTLEQPQADEEEEASPATWNPIWSNTFPEAEFFDRVLMLSQRLYSLQAIVAKQDSHIELQRASLTERASFPGRHRGNVLLEQEKQRTLALQREELATFHKLQSQHRQEQARWERERDRHQLQAEAMEGMLRQREEDCRRLEEKLAEEREDLERQREMYQQDLERLRESTRTVEKEKERLEQQRKIKRKTIEVMPFSSSLNGDLLLGVGSSGSVGSDLTLPQKVLVRHSPSVAPADYLERPEVLARGQSANATALPVKKEVPLHLCSTTNQQHKQVGVQQQIPTKLAALSSKSSKSAKATHRTDSTASLDMKQMLPMKLSAREDGSLKAKRSISPNQQLPHTLVHSQSMHLTVSLSPPDRGPENQPASLQKPPSQASNPLHIQPQAPNPLHTKSPNPSPAQAPVHGHSLPPPCRISEDVIFF